MMNEEQHKTEPSTIHQGSRMLFTHERRQQIARILEEQQRVTVSELSARFSVSEVTIRKDLTLLESQKLAVRTHGGATASTAAKHVEMDFTVRERIFHSEKARIGEAAASLVQDGETIALDASTTAFSLIPFLKTRRDLTIITNGLPIAMELIAFPGISVLLPGGMLRQESLSLVGNWGQAVLQQVHISKAFVGARGFTLYEGLTDVHSDEIELKRAIVEAAKEVIGIFDHSKWNQVAFATFCPFERIKTIITGTQAPAESVAQARNKGAHVWMV